MSMLIHKSLPTTVKYIGIPTAGVVPWNVIEFIVKNNIFFTNMQC